ncbi:MAG: DHHA1 domain-containing protein, partial [Desulfurivibrionaceae bacterium]|nr:DHHA1 domain-containing protein [Desulfurivibrionaceae bacterium]
IHRAEIRAGAIAEGDKVTLQVDRERRQRSADNHTATHLLQAALKDVLGDHVKQSGSLVDSDRLRFDFTSFSPLTAAQIEQVEELVNREIRGNRRVDTTVLDREEAIRQGATALFGEKYADKVRVVSVEQYSKELCGGTHVGATGEIGLFKIVSEAGIAAGIRRIEAVTGPAALCRFQQVERQLAGIAEQLKSTPEEISLRVGRIQARQKELERELARLAARQSVGELDEIVEGARLIGGTRVIAAKIKVDSPKTMREVGDKLRDKLGSGVAVVGAVFDDKVSLLAIVSKDLAETFHAGKLVKEVATIVGGSGGGRPDMAQAGGTMPDRLDEALAAVYGAVEKQGA